MLFYRYLKKNNDAEEKNTLVINQADDSRV